MHTTNTSCQNHALLVLNHDNQTGFDSNHPIQKALLRQKYQMNDTVWHIVYLLPPPMSYAYRKDVNFYDDWKRGIILCRHAARLLHIPMQHIEISHRSALTLIRQYQKRYCIQTVIGHCLLNR